MATIAEAIQLAVQAHTAGKIDASRQICRQILAADPRCANAWHLLGIIDFQAGKHAEAADHLQRAVQMLPRFAPAYNNLGSALMAVGRHSEAVAAFRSASEFDVNDTEAIRNLGYALKIGSELESAESAFVQATTRAPHNARAHIDLGLIRLDRGNAIGAAEAFDSALALNDQLLDAHLGRGNAALLQGDPDRAIAAYERCLQMNPGHVPALNNLGNAWIGKGDPDRAIECFRKALTIDRRSIDALNNLTLALIDRGDASAAVDYLRALIDGQSNNAEVFHNLAEAYRALNRFDESRQAFQQKLAAKSDCAKAHLGFASLLRDIGDLTESEAEYRRAIEFKPDYAEAFTGLGTLLRDTMRLDEAAAACRESMRLRPSDTKALSNALLLLQYQPGVNLSSLAIAHSEFETKFACRFRSAWTAKKRPRQADEPLRIGFVSPDFGMSPVGFLLIAGFEHFDRTRLHITSYCDRKVPDELTERFRIASHQWRDTRGWSDSRVDSQIRADGIDILYDLAGHTARNRLLVFARKPAPIQVSWLGHEGTTGLAAIDVLIGDPCVIPIDAEPHYTERVFRFPETYVCYEPPNHAPDISTLPAIGNGVFTFGCFNNPTKLNDSVLDAWSKVLLKAPQSRLLLKYRGLDDPGQQSRLSAKFLRLGIPENRLLFEGKSSHADYFAAYGRVDLALDPFPFCGGVTTCDALWMGVPVITLPGQTLAGRHSLSFLNSIGLTNCISENMHDYIDRAARWSADLPELTKLRLALRAKMSASTLCDGPRFARSFLKMQYEIERAHTT